MSDADVKQNIGNSHTEYKITGGLSPVLAAVAALFTDYHPHGYGTHLHWMGMLNQDGLYEARVTRMNSCD